MRIHGDIFFTFRLDIVFYLQMLESKVVILYIKAELKEGMIASCSLVTVRPKDLGEKPFADRVPGSEANVSQFLLIYILVKLFYQG